MGVPGLVVDTYYEGTNSTAPLAYVCHCSVLRVSTGTYQIQFPSYTFPQNVQVAGVVVPVTSTSQVGNNSTVVVPILYGNPQGRTNGDGSVTVSVSFIDPSNSEPVDTGFNFIFSPIQ